MSFESISMTWKTPSILVLPLESHKAQVTNLKPETSSHKLHARNFKPQISRLGDEWNLFD
jgi:hypothetical protein